jgi:transcriptional regulator of heat shock response
MKSAYEIAMERLEKEKPTVKLSERQLSELREIESVYEAKLAERRVFLEGRIQAAQSEGKYEETEEFRRQLVHDIANLTEEREAKRAKIRGA